MPDLESSWRGSDSAAKYLRTSTRSLGRRTTGSSVSLTHRRRQGTPRIICGDCVGREYFRANAEGDGFSSGRLTFRGSRNQSECSRWVAMTQQLMRDRLWRGWRGLPNRVGSVPRVRKATPRSSRCELDESQSGEEFPCNQQAWSGHLTSIGGLWPSPTDLTPLLPRGTVRLGASPSLRRSVPTMEAT